MRLLFLLGLVALGVWYVKVKFFPEGELHLMPGMRDHEKKRLEEKAEKDGGPVVVDLVDSETTGEPFARFAEAVRIGRQEDEKPERQREAEKPLEVLTHKFLNRRLPSEAELSRFFPAEKWLRDPSTNQVILTGREIGHFRAGFIAMDTAPVTLEIQAILGVFRLQAGYEFGLDWLIDTTGILESVGHGATARQAQGAFSFGITESFLSVSLEEGRRRGFLHVVGRPTLSCVSGETAELSSGRQIAVPVRTASNFESRTTVEFREVALSLEVEPVLLGGGDVLLTVVQRNEDVLGFRTIDGNEIPEISSQQVRSSLRMRLGEWIALGGATLVTHSDVQSDTSLFERVPIVRELLKRESESWERLELGIFLRVGLAKGVTIPMEFERPRIIPPDETVRRRVESKSFWQRFRKK